jgi:hypothetical protein
MKKILMKAALIVAVAGCASSQAAPEGGAAPQAAAPEAAAPAPSAPVADAPVAAAPNMADAPMENTFYTSGQARRGNGLFRDNCVSCHASSEFRGSSFERRWRNRAVGDMYEFVLYSMPDDNPGGLPEQTYADIVAYMLQLNDFPSGDTELPTSMDALMGMIMWAEAGGGQ